MRMADRDIGLTPRPLIVHAHMFKNAGSTFDWSLRRNFRSAFTDHREDEPMKRGAAYLGPWIERHPDCRAISSHWITPPLPAPKSTKLFLCLLFRDPIERMRSVYAFERQQQGVETPGAVRARRMSFVEYVTWRMEPASNPVVRNYQTRYCSGDYLGTDLSAMFDRAVALLDSTPTLGLVHRYDESMVLFEHHLRRSFPALDLSYLRQNVLAAAEGFDRRRRDVLEKLVPIEEDVLAANEYDMRLFELARARFEKLLKRVPDFDVRLEDLRGRSRRLHEEPGV